MRRFMNLSRRLALVAMLGAPLAACGKKDPAPPQPAAGVTEPAAPTAKPEDKTQKTGEEKAAEPAKPADAPPGTPSGAPPTAPASATAPPSRSALTTSALATIPEGFVAVAGTPNFGELFRAFAGMVASLEGEALPANALESYLKEIKENVGLDLGWLDTDKPMRFAVPDPKAHDNGLLLLLAVKADAKLEPTAILGATAGADGHWAKLSLDGRELWLDLADGHLVVSSDPGFIKAQAGFIKDLSAWVPSAPLVMDTSVENLRKTFSAELADAKEMASMFAGMAGSAGGSAQAKQIQQMADFGFALVDGLARMGFALDPTGDFPRLAITLRGTPESPVGKFAATTKDRKASFVNAAPADAWMVMGYDVPGLGYLSNLDDLVDQLSAPQEGNPISLSLSEADKKELKAKLARMMELQGSQSATWIKQVGTRILDIEGLSDSPDGKALLEAMLDAGDFFFQKLWASARKQMLAAGAPADQAPEKMSFRDFTGFMNRNLGMLGVGIEVKDATSKNGAKATGFELKVDWSRVIPGKDGRTVSELLGNQIGLGFSGHDKLFSMAFGPDASKRAADLIDRGVPAGGGDPWLAKASEGAIFFLLRPVRLLRGAAPAIPDLAENKALLDSLADDPLVLTGTSDGTTVSIELMLSKSHLKVLALLD